jgi:hypothetical protein
MAKQLDILALEPFYGGIRRAMLETVIRCSRHRWTLLKLPPRRMERRLTAAALWFAEQLSRHWVGRVDVLFTSEAMNLSDLFRRMPMLGRKPSVVYFHANQLPHPSATADGPWDLVNLGTAASANELWFNSRFHLNDFLIRAKALIARHPELAGRNPVPDIANKSRLIPPPVETRWGEASSASAPIERCERTIFLNTRDADLPTLNQALGDLKRMQEEYSLVTVGPVDSLSPDLPRRTVGEMDDLAQLKALQEAGTYLSASPGIPCDHHLVRALAGGCFPVLPEDGVYPELIPPHLHRACLYDGTPESLLAHLLDAWQFRPPDGTEEALRHITRQFDPLSTCRLIDERLEELVSSKPQFA